MLVLLCVLRRNGRSTSTKLARPTTDPFHKSKPLNPPLSSIRDTVILISPDRETPLLPTDAGMRRSSESRYSQDSDHNRDVNPKSGLRISVPQLPTIDLSPSLLALSPYTLESESKSKYSASSLSPPPPAPSRSFIYDDHGNVLSSGRMPSVMGSFAGSD
uniref:Rim20 protein n=1 Tax=Ganoderma boninense TaxID=34458 RepID=A0A5K1JYQ5_9APHY|nr:Rim20 protein [Ganoderma boninense]